MLLRRGNVFHYDFTVEGKRYRGTTKEAVMSRARMVESKLMGEARQRKLSVHHRSLTLAELSARFLEWVEITHLAPKSKNYYKSGWKMLNETPIRGMKIARITTDEASALRFPHSAANSNMAFRTLRRMLTKAAEWGLISAPPRIKLLKEEGRSAVIAQESERLLVEAASQPLQDVMLLVFDCGMRPDEVFKMRWEDLTWSPGFIFVPTGKTKRSRRYIPMSDRVLSALKLRQGTQTDGWVFPSDSKSGHTITVARAFAKLKKAVGLSDDVVLYNARHTFATTVLGETGDLSLVMRVMGHSTAQTAMIYQHPDLEAVRSVMNERNNRKLSRGHVTIHVTEVRAWKEARPLKP